MCNTVTKHPFFDMYRVKSDLEPLKYVVESFSLNEEEHYFTVEMALETENDLCDVVLPKPYINNWFKKQMPEVVIAYSYKEDGEVRVNWHHLYMDHFDIGKKLITRIFNDYMNDQQ